MSVHDVQLTSNLLERIDGMIPSMTRSDVKIARKLLEAPDAFVVASVRSIASDIGVSEPTIVRFCRTIGCEGFKDLKFRLTRELALRQAQLDASVMNTDEGRSHRSGESLALKTGSDDFAAHIQAKALEALQDAMASVDMEVVSHAAELIAGARKVVILGIGGSSAIMAEEVHNRLYRLGLASTVFTDSYAQRMAAATLGPSDVALFVSSTGRPRSLQDSQELATYYGAKSIAITDSATPLGREADLCLNLALSQSGVHEFQPNPMRYGQLLIIDLLAFHVALSLGPKAMAVLRQTRASIATLHGIAPQQPIGD